MTPFAAPIPSAVLACVAGLVAPAAAAPQAALPNLHAAPAPQQGGDGSAPRGELSRGDRYLFSLPRPASKDDTGAPPEAVAATDGEPEPGLTGRLILFFLPDAPKWAETEPIAGPFFVRPLPTASVAVSNVKPGDSIAIERDAALVSTHDLDALSGRWRVQAVLDADFTARGHLAPGNLVSDVISIELDPDRRDEVVGTLARTLPDRTDPPAADESRGVEWIERRSELLSRHLGRDTTLRAGVVLPFGYHDLAYPRRVWPTIYVVGSFGASHRAAADDAAMLRAPEGRGAIPQAVWVYLEAETPWGHSGFCDSDAHGPIGRALVGELIPFLEQRFRLISTADARVVTGHGGGGWSAIHLALTYPETFGACFASAPDPVDFSAFGRADLYRDVNLHVRSDGSETPSFRSILGPEDDFVHMTVREERLTEHALDPNGRSGQQWAAWEARWSPRDPARQAPRRIADPESGAIDPITVEAWSRHDIARRFERAPTIVAPLFFERVRVLCGTRDSFYLNESVARLKAKLESWRAQSPEPPTAKKSRGYIELLEGLDHDTIVPVARLRFHREIAAHLSDAGHAEWAQADPTWAPLRPEGSARPAPADRPTPDARP